MFARSFSIAIVAFWLLMTALMVRRVHFPDSLPVASVPVSLVMDTFFGQQSPSGEYDLLQSGRQIGTLTIVPRERISKDGRLRQIVFWNSGNDITIRWNAVVTLSDDSESLAAIDLEASIIGTDFDFEIHAAPGSDSVDYLVRRHGTVIADSRSATGTASLQAAAARSLLSSWGFSDGQNGAAREGAGEIKAFDHIADIAGRKRDVYSLVASLGPERDITLYFTKAGELVKVETFLDYQLRPAAIILD